ncbi:cell wall-binding repeat-containing protein [Clostridioides sp. ZZV14-6045]|nr:cell wall-binding repeat-containing protein [Clostridioides sp. ZZV14-6045]
MHNLKLFILTFFIVFLFTVLKPEALSDIKSFNDKDIYRMAHLISKQKNSTNFVIFNKDKLSDGLSASALAGCTDSSILFTNKDSLPKETVDALANAKKIYLLGGYNSISLEIEEYIKGENTEVIRLNGQDRFDTSYKVADEILKYKDIDKVFLANGLKGEADIISISPVAYRDGVPIILTNGIEAKYDLNNKRAYIIGGYSLMDNSFDKDKAIRLSGKDRYETNFKITNEFYNKDYKKVYLCDGNKYLNALLGSTVANENPIRLIDVNSPQVIYNGPIDVILLSNINLDTKKIKLLNDLINIKLSNKKEINQNELNDMVKDISYIDLSLLNILKVNNKKIIITDMDVTGIEEFKSLKGKKVPTYKDTTYEELAGLSNNKIAVAVLGKSHMSSSKSVILHETAHLIDSTLGEISKSNEFKKLCSDEAKNMYQIDYVTGNSVEYFAESVMNYYIKPIEMKNNTPNTYYFIEKEVIKNK